MCEMREAITAIRERGFSRLSYLSYEYLEHTHRYIQPTLSRGKLQDTVLSQLSRLLSCSAWQRFCKIVRDVAADVKRVRQITVMDNGIISVVQSITTETLTRPTQRRKTWLTVRRSTVCAVRILIG